MFEHVAVMLFEPIPQIPLELFFFLRSSSPSSLHLHHLYPYAAAWQTFVEHFPLWFSCFFRSCSLDFDSLFTVWKMLHVL